MKKKEEKKMKEERSPHDTILYLTAMRCTESMINKWDAVMVSTSTSWFNV